MKYRKGYKYQLAENEAFQTKILPAKNIETQFISLNTTGLLITKSGYAWDGPSGPTKSIVEILEKVPLIGKWLVKKFLKCFLRGSVAHDAGYQLIRQGYLDQAHRGAFDDLLYDICIEDKMSKVRAKWVYEGVDKFAGFAADPKNVKKVHEAP